MASENDELDADAVEEDDELAGPSDDSLLDEELDEDALDDDELVGDGDEDVLGDDPDELIIGEVIEGAVAVEVAIPLVAEGEDALSDDDDDEPDDDDVEASLDVILKERLVVNEEEDEDDEDEDVADSDDRGDGTTRVLPKQPGEFVCQSCFLVKSQTQLADKKKMFCRDCV